MIYCETIEESKTWVCPKSGIWKIICIGGGGAGLAYINNTLYALGTAGGTTSFGSILSALGGMSGADVNKNNIPCSFGTSYDWHDACGNNGYNGAGAYGTKSGDFIGSGYGASGGATIMSTTGNSFRAYNSGLPGNVKSVITDISEGTSIACTIGTGGTVTHTGDKMASSGIAFPGKSGAIIVQYLGSEM